MHSMNLGVGMDISCKYLNIISEIGMNQPLKGIVTIL